eukprot:gnl/Dysnectes_brevis/424_a467_3600.p1 GENE.gnl/Dysnectes_brevis/424_a467_3600~~gnl/Dysnectes_brevis/424_a467_3600.p1  ORF type:complete len:301 (-),score=100.57 gnl/Dysnectes_brevis/424_a467_3600:119-1021(-)
MSDIEARLVRIYEETTGTQYKRPGQADEDRASGPVITDPFTRLRKDAQEIITTIKGDLRQRDDLLASTPNSPKIISLSSKVRNDLDSLQNHLAQAREMCNAKHRRIQRIRKKEKREAEETELTSMRSFLELLERYDGSLSSWEQKRYAAKPSAASVASVVSRVGRKGKKGKAGESSTPATAGPSSIDQLLPVYTDDASALAAYRHMEGEIDQKVDILHEQVLAAKVKFKRIGDAIDQVGATADVVGAKIEETTAKVKEIGRTTREVRKKMRDADKFVIDLILIVVAMIVVWYLSKVVRKM